MDGYYDWVKEHIEEVGIELERICCHKSEYRPLQFESVVKWLAGGSSE